jgi:isopentenyl-diphosphate delta-isomerase
MVKFLLEHEFDHVFIGQFEGEVCFNKEEVNAYTYSPIHTVLEDVNQKPEKYTEWFKICLDEVVKRVL